MQKPVTTEGLIKALAEFDDSLELDESKIAEMPTKERGELFLAIQRVLKYREDFPPDLAQAVQMLAKQSVEKQGIRKGDSSFDLDLDTDGVVLESGEIIMPDDKLFTFAKELSQMSSKEVEQLVDDLGAIVANYSNVTLLKLMKKSVRQIEERVAAIEKKRGIKNDKQNDRAKGKWPTMTQQMN